jgi:flagellar biosynthetic protein FliR
VQGAQSALMATFMTLLGVTLIFAMNLHHLMIGAMLDSYGFFPVGEVIQMNDFADMMARNVSGAFLLGVQIASPFMVYGLIFNIGLGILARLMPQLQVFFVAMPLNIAMGMVIMTLVVSAAMAWFMQYMEQTIGKFMV